MVTVPVKAFPDLPAAPSAGKTVIDTGNYGPGATGTPPSELLLRYLLEALLVKAFNNIYYKHLLSLTRSPRRGGRPLVPADRRRLRAGRRRR